MSNHEREQSIERNLASMMSALRAISNYGDCLHEMHPDPDEPICQCPVCVARRALETETEWRYVGNHEHRRQFNPREAAIAHAWRRYMQGIGTGVPDAKLRQILGVEEVTARDWVIATTIIQWLATNVGSALLHEAGYRYDPPRLVEEQFVIEFRNGGYLQSYDAKNSGPLSAAKRFPSRTIAEVVLATHEWIAMNGGMVVEVPR